VLQDKTIQRLGGKETIPVDVRVLAATHRDLEQAIRDRLFREDLYYRLNDAVIHVPPLRERREDIIPLVDYFLQRYGPAFGHHNPGMTADAKEFLRQQAWPGNVRELENVVRKTLLSSPGLAIGMEAVRAAIEKTRLLQPMSNQPLAGYIHDLLAAAVRGEMENVASALIEVAERELYAQAIRLAGGNQARAAKWLGVSRPTMREKLRAYGLRSLPEGGAAGLDI
jgi:DNA-binding NtrC family response regulator